jgi:hypothetical protein
VKSATYLTSLENLVVSSKVSNQKNQLQLALWAEGKQQLLTNQPPGGTTSENLPALDSPSHKGKFGFKYAELNPSKSVQYGGATSVAIQHSTLNLRKDRDT